MLLVLIMRPAVGIILIFNVVAVFSTISIIFASFSVLIMARTKQKKKKQSMDSSGASKRQKVEPLKRGDEVEIHNLNEEDDELNGESGQLVEYDSRFNSWSVATKNYLVDVKAENLKRKDQEIAAPDRERESLSCPTHVYVLILEEWNHGWGGGHKEDAEVVGVYISKEAAALAAGDIGTSYGTFDEAIEPERGTFSDEFDYEDNRKDPPDDGILIQLGGKDIGEGDYVRLKIKIQKKPLL